MPTTVLPTNASIQKPPSLLPIFLLSAAGFTVLTTEFIIVGLLPPMARDLGVSVSQAGLLVTLFAVTVAVVGPLLTARVAHYERKTLFVSVLLLFAGSNVLAALSPNIAVMAVARFLPALGLPVFWSLASETGMRIMGPAQAGKAVSMVGTGVVAATIFGIPIGTLISDRFGWRTAFGVIAALALAKAAMLFVYMPRIRVDGERVPVWRQLGILREGRILGHVGLSLLVFAGMFTAYTYLADILEKLGGYGGTAVGWILMGFGAVGLPGNWLGGRCGSPPTTGVGWILRAAGGGNGAVDAIPPVAGRVGADPRDVGNLPIGALHGVSYPGHEGGREHASPGGIAEHLGSELRHRPRRAPG